MTRKQRLKELSLIAYAVESLCQRSAGRELDELQEAAAKQERQHRAAGKRIAGKRYPTPVRSAVEFFTCQCVLTELKTPTCWKDARVRTDWLHGQVAREILKEHPESANALSLLEERWAQLGADYSVDIAGNR